MIRTLTLFLFLLATITTQPTCASSRIGASTSSEPNREMNHPAHALLARESVWVKREFEYQMAMDQCEVLRIRAENARERLECARRERNEEDICHHTHMLDQLTREIREIQESQEPYIQELKALDVGDLFREIQETQNKMHESDEDWRKNSNSRVTLFLTQMS